MEHFGENSVDTLERRWEVLAKMRKQETNCRRFDNTPGTRKHRATELFNKRHGLSALFCSGFLVRWRLPYTNLSTIGIIFAEVMTMQNDDPASALAALNDSEDRSEFLPHKTLIATGLSAAFGAVAAATTQSSNRERACHQNFARLDEFVFLHARDGRYRGDLVGPGPASRSEQLVETVRVPSAQRPSRGCRLTLHILTPTCGT
jgi:hypothetical protein